jgi:hypothetical protein
METVVDASLQRKLVLYFRSCTPDVSSYLAEVLYLDYMYVFNTGAGRYEKKIHTVISAPKNFSNRSLQRLTDRKTTSHKFMYFFLLLFCTGQ